MLTLELRLKNKFYYYFKNFSSLPSVVPVSTFDHDGRRQLSSILFLWVISFTVTFGTFFILELQHADFCYNKVHRHCGSKVVSVFPELCWQNGDVRKLLTLHNPNRVRWRPRPCLVRRCCNIEESWNYESWNYDELLISLFADSTFLHSYTHIFIIYFV